MTRSQGPAQAGGAVAKPAASSGRHRARGGGGRRPDAIEKAPASAPRCWQSGVKPKEATTAEVAASVPATPAATGPTVGPQRGWGELPAAERASRCAQLQEMGFSASAVQKALEECAWDVNQALDNLFTTRSLTTGNDCFSVTKSPQITAHSTQPSSQHTGARTQKARSQAAACDAKAWFDASRQGALHCAVKGASDMTQRSTTGDSTSASGGSSPRLHNSMSPQRDVSCASSADDSIEMAPHEKTPSLNVPPGLEEMPMLLAVPPGLQDEPTPCPSITKVVESTTPSVLQVPGIAVPVAGASPAAAVSVVPKRMLQKVQHTWECEEHCSTTQLSVEEGTFVYVWSDSKTETGWIYAESLICCSRAGWLPESMLQQLPPNRLWMRISTACHATHPVQLQVEAGNMVLVDASQDPVNGWVYAEQVASATGRTSLQGLIGAGGWVPIQCVKWPDV